MSSVAGTATFNFAPGTYIDHTYTYLTAANGIVGRSSNIVYQGRRRPRPRRRVRATPTPTSTLTSTSRPATNTGFVVRPQDEQLASEQNQVLAQITDKATETLLGV